MRTGRSLSARLVVVLSLALVGLGIVSSPWASSAVRRGVVEVTVPRGTRVRGVDAIVHESLDLRPEDCTFVGPIPVTTPARTLIDLGAVVRWERVEEAFDGA